jgi:hypothetical protein
MVKELLHMKVKYSYSETGCTCDRCGTSIKHVYTVSDDSKSFNVGSDCINKLTNLAKESNRIVESMAKELGKIELQLTDFQTNDYDMIKSKYFPNSKSSSEDFKIAVVDHIKFLTLKLQTEEKKMSLKMKNINIK